MKRMLTSPVLNNPFFSFIRCRVLKGGSSMIKYVWVFWLCLSVLSGLYTEVQAEHLSFYVPSGATTENSRMYLELVRQFEQEHPEAQVRFVPMESYNEVLETVLTLHQQGVGDWVAVVEVSELMTLKDAGAVLNLDDRIAAEPGGRGMFLQRFLPVFLTNCRGEDGTYYALPFYRSTPIIYYNLDMLRQAEVDEHKLPTTWDELENLLERLKASTGRPPFGLAPTWHEWIFEAFVRQNGGALANESNTQVLFDHPKTIETLAFWKRLKEKGLLEQFPRTWKATLKSFALQQRYPVIYYSTGGMELVNREAGFDWATGIMPKNTTFGTPIGGANIFISTLNTSAQQQLAWELVQYVLQPHIQAQISSQSGYFPVRFDAFDDPLIKERYQTQGNFRRARQQLEFAYPKIMTHHYQEIRKILQHAIDQALAEGVPPDQSLRTAQKEAQKWLQLH